MIPPLLAALAIASTAADGEARVQIGTYASREEGIAGAKRVAGGADAAAESRNARSAQATARTAVTVDRAALARAAGQPR